jgi:hypothetical protein
MMLIELCSLVLSSILGLAMTSVARIAVDHRRYNTLIMLAPFNKRV